MLRKWLWAESRIIYSLKHPINPGFFVCVLKLTMYQFQIDKVELEGSFFHYTSAVRWTLGGTLAKIFAKDSHFVNWQTNRDVNLYRSDTIVVAKKMQHSNCDYNVSRLSKRNFGFCLALNFHLVGSSLFVPWVRIPSESQRVSSVYACLDVCMTSPMELPTSQN